MWGGWLCLAPVITPVLASEFSSEPFIHLQIFPRTLVPQQIYQVKLWLLSSKRLDEDGDIKKRDTEDWKRVGRKQDEFDFPFLVHQRVNLTREKLKSLS